MMPALASWSDLRDPAAGEKMHALAQRLWPIPRSLTGRGLRESLQILAGLLPDLKTYDIASGTKVFDWTIPDEWNVSEAYIVDPDGKRICDFAENNLHLVGYSVAVHQQMTLEELQEHLHSLPEQPGAIPYVTSYYRRRWGFCLSENQRRALKAGTYTVVIQAELAPGKLTYGELVIEGESKDEILISTYLCHPSMANNELSGPVVSTYLALWLLTLPSRRHTYRFFFGPETIGSIAYIANNLGHLKKHVKAGYVVTCIGDERAYSFLPSRLGTTGNDSLTQFVLNEAVGTYVTYSHSDRGSDERQYCSPLVDLPVVSVMRSKYSAYPEYHTSLDDLKLVTPAGLEGGLFALKCCLWAHERNLNFKAKVFCEPQLGKRGLYPELSTKDTKAKVRTMMDILAYCDGNHSPQALSQRAQCSLIEVYRWLDIFETAHLIEAKSN